MAASTGKTVGLILLIIFIIALSLKLTPLILAPLGIFSGAARVIHAPDLNMGNWMYRWNSMSLFSMALFIIWIAVIIWVYRDAERRGMNGILWALLVLIGNLIALIIYLIIRSDNPQVVEGEKSLPPPATPPPPPTAPPPPAVAPPQPSGERPCPNCTKRVPVEFAFCPHCGSEIETVCPACNKTMEKDWKVCPYCGEKKKKA